MMEYGSDTQPRGDCRVALIQILSGAAVFGAGVFIPILARQELAATDYEIGLLVSFYGASLFISSYVFGRAADMHGRRPYIIGGLLLSAFSCALLFYTMSFLHLLILRVFVGICAGIFPSALTAYAYEHGIRMGKYSSNMGMGMGIGAIIAGLIVLMWGEMGYSLGRDIYNPVFIGCSILFLICFATSLTLPFTKPVTFKIPFVPVQILKKNLAIYASVLIRHSGACAVWAFFSLFIYVLQPAGTPQHVRFFWVGVINGLNGLCQFVFMRFVDRYDYDKLILSGFFLSILVFILFVMVGDIWQLLLSQILLALAFSCLYVGALCSIMERNAEHATSAGLLNAMLNASQVIGPLIGGVTSGLFAANEMHILGFHIGGSEVAGYRGVMCIAALMSAIALCVYWLGLRRKKSD